MATYRVLVVEDNHEVRRMVTASIKTLGAEIDVLDVPSAEEALFISASLPLDLVVLDFRLPGMSGLEMVSRLRKRRPEAKIILVTGVDDTVIRQQVANAAVEAYFYKPIEIAVFLEAVKHCLWSDQLEPAQPPGLTDPAVTPSMPNPAPSSLPATSEVGGAAPQRLMPTIDERLTTLKQQLRAVSVLMVNDAGQVLEVVGNPSQITSGSAVLSALMQAFKASLQVSQAMGRGVNASLQYFAVHRQCLYVAPIGTDHALLIISSGNIEPDKLSTIDRYIQLAVRDLQAILDNTLAEELARQDGLEKFKTDLPQEAVVDQETLARVEDMFTKAAKSTNQVGADNFWDAAGGNDALDGVQGKDVLTYDQARDLGLAPGENTAP